MTIPQYIRPIAICVIEEGDELFVFEAQDPATGETFYRPLGGGIEFGELGVDCVVRELQEEIGAEVEGITYLGVIENLFTLNAEMGHEIVLVYRARLADTQRYRGRPVLVQEEVGTLLGRWMPLTVFQSGDAHLVPEGLLDLLEQGE